MKDCFLFIDYLGITPRLLINGHRSSSSILGGLISLFVGILLVVGSGYFTIIFLCRTNFSVLTSEETDPKSFKDWKHSEISLNLVDRYFNEIPNKERLYGITAQVWTDRRITNPNGTISSKTIIDPVETEQCNVDKNFGETKELWRNEKLINASTCIKPGQNVNSTGTFGSTGYTGVVFWIHFCTNTSVKTDCYPKEVIKKQLENVFCYVKFIDYFFDHNSLTDIGVPFIYTELVQASSSAYKRQWYNFQNIDYISDEGYILSSEMIYNFTSLGSTSNSIDLRGDTTVPDSFFVVSLNMHPLKKHIDRKYYKAQNLLADLGGLVKGILMAGICVNYYFSRLLYFEEIINSNIHSLVPKDSEVRKTTETSLNIKLHSGIANNFFKHNLNCTNFMKIIQSAPHKVKIPKTEIFFPRLWFCSKKNLPKSSQKFYGLKEIIEEQLDVKNLIKKINTLDKTTYALFGEGNLKLLESCVNINCIHHDEIAETPEELRVLSQILNHRKNF